MLMRMLTGLVVAVLVLSGCVYHGGSFGAGLHNAIVTNRCDRPVSADAAETYGEALAVWESGTRMIPPGWNDSVGIVTHSGWVPESFVLVMGVPGSEPAVLELDPDEYPLASGEVRLVFWEDCETLSEGAELKLVNLCGEEVWVRDAREFDGVDETASVFRAGERRWYMTVPLESAPFRLWVGRGRQVADRVEAVLTVEELWEGDESRELVEGVLSGERCPK